MGIWMWVLFGILLCVILGLLAKLLIMRKSAREIEKEFSERLTADTNILIDISSHDRCMKRLAASVNVQLKKLRQERHRFQQGDLELKNAVTNISHDLRTPLTAISGYLDLLDREEKNDTVSRYIGIIRNRTEALEQLTEELFRYSVITSPEYDATAEPLSVNRVLEESILGFYGALQERKITPNVRMPEHKVVRTINRVALSRVFSNLMNNALKYSDGDLEITLTESGTITFSNMASGLSEVQVEKLFDRFYTVESGRKSTGLGLSISRVLVEQMNGTIMARYNNKRLSICIQLPDEKGTDKLKTVGSEVINHHYEKP